MISEALVIRKSLRFSMPLTLITRYALRDFEFEGHRIPANTPCAISPLFTHYRQESGRKLEAGHVMEGIRQDLPRSRIGNQRRDDQLHRVGQASNRHCGDGVVVDGGAELS